jgi:hypothetical protein
MARVCSHIKQKGSNNKARVFIELKVCLKPFYFVEMHCKYE